jgi:hypothetical protein
MNDEELEIPEDLQWAFKRVVKKIPSDLKCDTELKKKIFIYLKLGGEKLARQRIELIKKEFKESEPLISRQVEEEGLEDEI